MLVLAFVVAALVGSATAMADHGYRGHGPYHHHPHYGVHHRVYAPPPVFVYPRAYYRTVVPYGYGPTYVVPYPGLGIYGNRFSLYFGY
jgi:hypothetical protein